MEESRKSEYFVDGFLIRHFGIYPHGFDKDDLFEEQKVFLMYLVGQIPEMDVWGRNVSYQTKLKDIRGLKEVEIPQAELDLASMRKQDITELKRQKLVETKRIKIAELNQEYGIKETDTETQVQAEIKGQTDDPRQLWDMLQLKGLTK